MAILEKAKQIEEAFNWYAPYLLPGENIEYEMDVGFWLFKLYKILVSNKRLIIIKKFPKNLIEINYNNIELVEYYTNVEWAKSIYSFFLFVLSFVFLFNSTAILNKIYSFIPPLEPLLDASAIFGLTVGSLLIFLALFFGAVYHTGLFARSLFGSIRILLLEQAPFDITTKMTTEIQQFIRLVEARKGGFKIK